MNRLKRLQNYIAHENKKLIVLFTTLVNVKCLAYHIFSQVFFGSNALATVTFANSHFAATTVIAVLDLWLCWGFIHSYVKANSFEEHNCESVTQSALQTAKSLVELHRGNIVMSGIYGFDYVTQIESGSVKGDEIWCISGDIEEDSNNSKLRNIISNNLKKGVVYKYFVTRLGETISSKARLGEEKLRENNIAYKKRLIFIKTNEELVAPDIDIIIYKANQINERVGFVCVEIGDDQDTYVYQQIDSITLQGICDRLSAYATAKKQSKFLPRVYSGFQSFLHFCIKYLSIPYFVASTGGLALLSFSKIVSLTSAALFLFPAIIELWVTVALMMRITDSIATYKDVLTISLENEDTLASFIDGQEIKSATAILEKNTLDTLMNQKGLGHTDKILQIDGNCSAIWLLSDLSHDIANQSFYDWLMKELDTYQGLECNILYTKGVAAKGRIPRLNRLRDKYSDRVRLFPLDDISAHYIWSETHGIVLMENTNMQHDVYISLGTGDSTFYKKVITTEEESSTLLGRLANIAGIDL